MSVSLVPKVFSAPYEFKFQTDFQTSPQMERLEPLGLLASAEEAGASVPYQRVVQ